MTDKAVFVSTVLLCVQRYRGNAIFTTPIAAPNGKEFIFFLNFHSDQCEKTKWAGNMLIFNIEVKMKRLGIRFKNVSFQ